jgi:hypothetical protein
MEKLPRSPTLILQDLEFSETPVKVVGHHEEPGKGRQLGEVLQEGEHVTEGCDAQYDLLLCDGQADEEDHQGCRIANLAQVESLLEFKVSGINFSTTFELTFVDF